MNSDTYLAPWLTSCTSSAQHLASAKKPHPHDQLVDVRDRRAEGPLPLEGAQKHVLVARRGRSSHSPGRESIQRLSKGSLRSKSRSTSATDSCFFTRRAATSISIPRRTLCHTNIPRGVRSQRSGTGKLHRDRRTIRTSHSGVTYDPAPYSAHTSLVAGHPTFRLRNPITPIPTCLRLPLILLALILFLPLSATASTPHLSPRSPTPRSDDGTPSDDDGDSMTVACADTSLTPFIPSSLQTHPFDSSSHYFSVASNLFCAKRPGFIIQRVYLSDNASEVVTDHDTAVIRRVCEETLGVVEGQEGEEGREWDAPNRRRGTRRDGRWRSRWGEWEGWYERDARAEGVGTWASSQVDEGTREHDSVSNDKRRRDHLPNRPRQITPSGSHGTSYQSTASTASTSTTTPPAPSSTSTSPYRAQLHRGATYSNKEGVWVIDICAIPPELLEQDELVYPPSPPPPGVGGVDAAISSSVPAHSPDNGGAEEDEDEDEDEDAKALEARRKERMVLVIQALEGTGVQGMSVAGSRKVSAGARRRGMGVGGVIWGVMLGWTALMVLGQMG